MSERKAGDGAARRPPAPLHAAPLLDRTLKRKDWRQVFAALLKKATEGNTTAASLLLQYRFGRPRPSDTTDPRYLSFIRIIDPSRPSTPEGDAPGGDQAHARSEPPAEPAKAIRRRG